MGNTLKKLARAHMNAVHDNCAIINVGNDQSNILGIVSVLHLIGPVFQLSTRGSDVST